MKRTSRIFLALGFLGLIIISWLVVLGAESNTDKQLRLIGEAEDYLIDEIYILAVPLLEEAAGINAEHKETAETLLKQTYVNLIDKRGFQRKYLDLLSDQMNRPEPSYQVFMEAANFHIGRNRFADAYEVLKAGIEKTGNDELKALYESSRYQYRMGYERFEDVTETYLGTVGVSMDGLWGIASTSGSLFIPCEYEKVSTFSNGRAIVKSTEGIIFAVDSNNNRIALLKPEDGEKFTDIGNLAGDRIPIELGGKWFRTTGNFERGQTMFDWVGMQFDGHAAAVQGGKAGVINISGEWIVPAEYDEIITDSLGRAYAQGTVFAKKGSTIYIIKDGIATATNFEDAKPFGEEGYAAVKTGGKWGFADTSGQIVIAPQFEDAHSFGMHLAAVKIDDMWGYVNLPGDIVIEPVFFDAGSFSRGSAPVFTERGAWQFITLIEYMEGVSL